ncbi:actin [Fragilaria crotonensis]|nr:actin [Fragilaria crotonensis]
MRTSANAAVVETSPRKRRRTTATPTTSPPKKGSRKSKASTTKTTPSTALPPPTKILLIDNGGCTLKYGIFDPHENNSSVSLSASEESVFSMPNVTARLKHQWDVLVGDDVTAVQPSQIQIMMRSTERGCITNMGNQVQVWKRILEKLRIHVPLVQPQQQQQSHNTQGGGGGDTAAEAFGWKVSKQPKEKSLYAPSTMAVVIMVSPLCPRTILEQILQVWFHDFGFAHVGLLTSQAFGGGTAMPTTTTTTPPWNTECCTVVDLGWSASHVVPLYQERILQSGFAACHSEDDICLEFKEELETARTTYLSKRPFDREFVLPDYQTTHKGFVRLTPWLRKLENDQQELLQQQKDETEEEEVVKAIKVEEEQEEKDNDDDNDEMETSEDGEDEKGKADDDDTGDNTPTADKDSEDVDEDVDSDNETDDARRKRLLRQKQKKIVDDGIWKPNSKSYSSRWNDLRFLKFCFIRQTRNWETLVDCHKLFVPPFEHVLESSRNATTTSNPRDGILRRLSYDDLTRDGSNPRTRTPLRYESPLNPPDRNATTTTSTTAAAAAVVAVAPLRTTREGQRVTVRPLAGAAVGTTVGPRRLQEAHLIQNRSSATSLHSNRSSKQGPSHHKVRRWNNDNFVGVASDLARHSKPGVAENLLRAQADAPLYQSIFPTSLSGPTRLTTLLLQDETLESLRQQFADGEIGHARGAGSSSTSTTSSSLSENPAI